MKLNPNDLLGSPITSEYQPSGSAGLYGSMFFSRNRQPIFHPRFVPDMMTDSRIKFGMWMIKGPMLASARFYINDGSQGPEHSPVKKFIVHQITRFWRQSAAKALRAIEWGWCGHEALYHVRQDQIQFNTLKVLQPMDVRLWTRHGQKIGMTVNRLSTKYGKLYLGGPKAFWHTHGREESPYYGVSRLSGAFGPWLEFYADSGAKAVRRLYYYKYAYSGEIGYYPPGEPPTEQGAPGDPQVNSNKNVMRRILDQRKTGGTAYFPSTSYDNGAPKWRIEPAMTGPSPANILEYHDMLKREIFDGLGIPSEVAEAAETGSGWSGRQIPATAFFAILQEMVNWLIVDFDEQVLRPLVMLNFMKAHDYEIVPFGLLKGSQDQEDKEHDAKVGVTSTERMEAGAEEGGVPKERQDAAFSQDLVAV